MKFLVNGEEIHTDAIHFGISKYVLTPEAIVDENGNVVNPEKGDSLDLSKVGFALQEYRDGNLYQVEDTSKYRLEVSMGTDDNGETWYDYDTEGWDMQKVSGQDLPIMTRKIDANTWFAVTVLWKEAEDSWNQVARRQYFFDSLYEDGDDENGDGEDGDTWHNDVSEEQSNYELWIDFEDTIGNGAMLPNSEMTIVTNLQDKTDDYSAITDYKLEIVEQSTFGEATVSSDGKSLVMKSKDKIGDGNCYVSVQIPDGNGGYKEAFKKEIYFSVSKYMLTPGTFVDANGEKMNPEVWESIDLSNIGIELKEYRDGNYIRLVILSL